MRLRSIGLISTLVLGLLVGPLPAEAQQAGKVPLIGYLSTSIHKYDDVFCVLFPTQICYPGLWISGSKTLPRKSPYVILLSHAERHELQSVARKYTSPYRDVIRAKIILYAADGLANDIIASRLDTPRQIVSKWRKRFHEVRLSGLEEHTRGGAPARFSPQRRRRS